MASTETVGNVYLLCLGDGLSRGKQPGNARHYVGWAIDVERRLNEHTSGGRKSSPLVKAATEAGCEVTLARVWPDVTRAFERFIKDQKHAPRHCPLCKPTSKGIILDIEPDPNYEATR
jgi:hypothetical protein